MKSRMITISENLGSFQGKKEIYNFCITENGKINSIEQNLIDMLKDMDKRGYVNIKRFNNIYKYENMFSLSNVTVNLKNPILNLNENLTIVKNKICSKSLDSMEVNNNVVEYI